MEMSRTVTMILFGIIAFGMLFLFSGGISKTLEEMDKYNKYQDFCEIRPNCCYCELGECSFKTSSYSSTQITNGILTNSSKGMSDDTKNLCELAKQLNDKKVLFDVGC